MNNPRSHALADRLEKGARALAEFASALREEDWYREVPGDGRTVGVIVHHVAAAYPIEMKLAQIVGAGTPLTGLLMKDIHEINATHATKHQAVTREEALELLWTNSVTAAALLRTFTHEQLEAAVPASLYANAPVTCQFVLEDHAVRHSYHHLAALRAAVGRS